MNYHQCEINAYEMSEMIKRGYKQQKFELIYIKLAKLIFYQLS